MPKQSILRLYAYICHTGNPNLHYPCGGHPQKLYRGCNLMLYGQEDTLQDVEAVQTAPERSSCCRVTATQCSP